MLVIICAHKKSFNVRLKTLPLFFDLFFISVRKSQEKLIVLEQKLHDTETNQSDRVDKNLLKNLLIGYIVAPNNDKAQILKLLSSVLDFNQNESDKVGLNKGHGGWLNSMLQGGGNTQNGKEFFCNFIY